VVNALVAGRGAAIGIDLPCKVRAKLVPREKREEVEISTDLPDPHGLAKASALYALKFLGMQNPPKGYSLALRVESEIPEAVGLKSSSAVSNAIVQSIFSLFNQRNHPKTILDASCSASKHCGASLTGAYDDASASLLGGLVLTNNKEFSILKHDRVPSELGSIVLVRIPKADKRFTSSIDTHVYSRFKKESREAFEYARGGQIAQAMIENSIVQCAALCYSFSPITEALMAGASAAGISGKGPSIAAMCSSSKVENRIRRIWLEEDTGMRIIKSQIVQPRTLFKTR
jgi:shikimate kinase